MSISNKGTTEIPSMSGLRNSSSKIKLLIGIVILGLSIGWVYYPSLSSPFIFDDTSTVIDNPSIRQLWPLVGRSEKSAPLSPPPATAIYARPLVNLSLAVNYRYGELNPISYRATHVLLHFLSALLLWAIIARTLQLDYFRKKIPSATVGLLSFFSALIWATHPLVTESVIYITQRTELMMGFLYLATLYFCIRYWSTARPKARTLWACLAAASCFSGMLCKEMIASAPMMMLLFERTFFAKSVRKTLIQSWPLYVGLSLTWLPAIAFSSYGQHTPMTGFNLGVTALEWWFTQAKVFFLYLQLVVWPAPLVIHYEIPYLKTLAEAWPWLLAAGLYTVTAFTLLWRRSAVGYLMVWVLAVLSPTLVIPLVGETMAERRMYVPLVALTPLFIVGLYLLSKNIWPRIRQHTALNKITKSSLITTSILAIALSLGYGHLSAKRLTLYQNELTLWQDAALHQPNDPLVRANLGICLTKAGQLHKSLPQFEAWVKLRPDSHWAHYNLARVLEGLNQPSEAIKQYRAVLKIQSDHAASHYNLARLLENQGQWPQAMKHYQQAVDAQPELSAAHTNLGLLHSDLGDLPAAIKHFELALQTEKSLNNYTELMLALMQANRKTEAITYAEKALSLAQAEGKTSVAAELENILTSLRLRLINP